MLTLLSEVHFWTTQEDVIIKHTDYGSFKYYPKREGNNECLNGEVKKRYCELRGIVWSPLNKRPQKLRDKLKELEEYLLHNKIAFFRWDENKLRLLLSTGLIVNVTVNTTTGDINNIVFDKQLSTKLQVNIISDGTILENQVICICNDGHVLGFGGHWKDGWVLEGGPRRNLNYHGEWLAVWGKAGAEHPQPWSPLAKDHQRANLHVYWIGARDPELLAYKKTDGEPLQVVVSKICSRTLIVVEQKVTQRGAVSVEVSNLELVGNNLKRVSVTSVPLQTQVSCTALSICENRLLICCIDGSLGLLDRNRGFTRTVKAAFIPTFAAWHPCGAIVVISNERGQLQYYDTALNSIKSQILGEDCTPTAMIDLSSYFNLQFSIASIDWGPKDIIFSLEQGPLVTITHIEKSLTFNAIIEKYLIIGKVEKAIKLLLSWEFNEDCFSALQHIVAYLMRLPLTEEVARHLQNALASFHSSPVPLSTQVRHRFGNQVFSLTRRFFHQLVRGHMFETAFLLAVDVGHHDLFMDLHYVAVKIGETEMAAAARAQASSLLSRCSSEASNCSRSSCSQCSESESSSSTEYNSSDIKREQPQEVVNKSDYSQLSPINSDIDNYLTTNFNQPDPTTYKSAIAEKEISPKKSQAVDYSKLNYTPRATYVKSPQVPSNFTKKNLSVNSNIPTPPLPYTPPLPNLYNSTLGIPYMQSPSSFNNFQNSSAFTHIQANNNSPRNNILSHNVVNIVTTTNNCCNRTANTNSNTATMYSAFSSSNLMVNNIKSSFTSITKVIPPPLPNINQIDSVIHSANTSQDVTPQIAENMSTSTNCKKHQSKVKFSDTVTAFIVPEIKRPQRPPPPSHVTDPQRELADSLPLCHPNEDYLKDFTPVRKEDIEENSQQPKIKVVHFGVV